MFRQVCTIEPSFFKTTSGMHRPPFEGRYLVWSIIDENSTYNIAANRKLFQL